MGPDPRALFAELAALDYRIPAYGADLFRRVIGELGIDGPLLDLCCSFGQDAALLNCHLALDELYAHYGSSAAAPLTRGELLERDAAFFASRRRGDAVAVVGLDVSAPAIAYGRAAGLLDDGVVADLETDPATSPAPDLAAVAAVGGIGVTGAISYIGPRTFARVLDAAEGRPWVAGFALRWIDISGVLSLFRERGYTVQVLADHAVIQRRTADADDASVMLAGLAAMGRTATSLELSGVHTAVPFLATPPGTPAPPLLELARLVGAASG